MQSLTKDQLHAYAGSNGKYYSQFLARYQASPLFLSWNWAAFFFLPFWLAYRKLWKSLALILILQLLFILVISQLSIGTAIYNLSPSLILYSLEKAFDPLVLLIVLTPLSFISLAVVLLANSFYLNKAEETMLNREQGASNTGNDSLQIIGKSIPAIFVTILILFLIQLLAWALVDNRLTSLNELYAQTTTSDSADPTLSKSKEGKNKEPVQSAEIKKLKTQIASYSYNGKNTQELEEMLAPYDDISSLTTVDELHKPLESLLLNDEFTILSKLVDKKINIKQFAEHHNYELVKHAFKRENWGLLQFLSEKGGYSSQEIDLMRNTHSGDEGRALQIAIKENKPDIVRWMLKEKVPVKAKFYKGKSPLMLAVNVKSIEIIKLLLAKGANPNYKSLNGTSAASLAVETKDADIIELLSKK